MYYVALAERAERGLIGADQLRWLDDLERDQDNLRAALAWSIERAADEEGGEAAVGAEMALRLAGALFWFWFVRDQHPEALGWLDQALMWGTAVSPAVRAKALFGAGVFAWSLNDLTRAEGLLTESVALSREIGDRGISILALGALGLTLCQNGQDEHGGMLVEESIVLARELGEPWLLAYALLHRLLKVAYGPALQRDGERTDARAAGAEALELYRAAGDGVSIAAVELCLGELALHEGDYERAEASFRSALPVMRAVGWRRSVADGLARLGDVARAQGDFAEAHSLYAEARTLYHQSGRHLAANLLPIPGAISVGMACDGK
jgi:non-specific serine/threonine protein kinase